jgi:hypothetical protein
LPARSRKMMAPSLGITTTRHGARRVPFASSPPQYRIAYRFAQLSTSIPLQNPNAATPDATVSEAR